MRTHSQLLSVATIAAPLIILLGLGTAIIAMTNPRAEGWTTAPEFKVETISIPRGWFQYREPGEFTIAGHVIDGPVTSRFVRAGIEVMKYQVSTADYDLCVMDGACAAREAGAPPRADVPATGLSYLDAVSYAQWLSAVTGQHWRLPTDEEAAYFRNNRPEVRETDARNSFVDKWLGSYREGAQRPRETGTAVMPFGSFEENVFGVADTGGNVWEWTSTCYARVRLAVDGAEISRTENCGVRVLQGQHIAYLSGFMRDAISGGCAAGMPPDYLGMRLVRERHLYESPLRFVRNLVRVLTF